MKKIIISLISLIPLLGCTIFQELLEPGDIVKHLQDTYGDKIPPVVIITSPTNNQEVGSNYQITGTAIDSGGSGIKAVYVKTDNGAYSPISVIVTNWTADISLSGEGTHTNYIYAEDNAGNTSEVLSLIVHRANNPWIIILYPPLGTITNVPGITIVGSAGVDGTNQISKVQVKLNDGAWADATGTTNWSKAVTLIKNVNTVKARAICSNNKTNESPVVSLAYVYKDKFVPFDGIAGQAFGCSVSISSNGNIIAAGASGDDDKGTHSGSVYRFKWNGFNWEENKFVAYDGAANDVLGISVGISADGNTIVAGAYGDNGAMGSVYCFKWNETNWITNKFIAYDGAVDDRFGMSVAISGDGNTIVAGAYLDDDHGVNSGSVYRFRWNGTNWVTNKFVAYDGAANDGLGISVAVSADGNTIVAGAYGDEAYQGSVYRFQWNGFIWETNKITASDGTVGDIFGFSVSVTADGDTIVAGAFGNDSIAVNSGSIYRFEWNGFAWETQKFFAYDGAASDYFGVSVTVSADGNTIAAGSYCTDNYGLDSGSAYFFRWNGSVWGTAEITAFDSATGDNFGISVALSSDGNMLTVGAYLDDDNGADSGSIYRF